MCWFDILIYFKRWNNELEEKKSGSRDKCLYIMTRFKVGRSKSDDVVGGRGEEGGSGGGWKLAIDGRYFSFALHFNCNRVQHPVYPWTQ